MQPIFVKFRNIFPPLPPHFPLAIFEKMMYTIEERAGVMGSDGGAACGG